MTKRKSTKRALLLSALALLTCVSMLVGTTFAWFTDSVTSSGNIIKAGKLDVAMYWAEGSEAVPANDTDWTDASTGAIFDYSLWEPGYVQVRHVKIANEGSLALKYKVNIVANGAVSELADVIDVYYVDPAVQVADRTALTADKKLGTLNQVLADLGTTGFGELAAGESDTVTIALKMQESAGNEYQTLEIGSDFAVQLVATQLTYEEDSFDKLYDEDAVYPDVVSGNYEGGDVIEAGDVKIQLPDSLPRANYTLDVEKLGAKTNAQGETTLSFNIDLLKDGVKIPAEAGAFYDVEIDAGKNLVVTEVSHNGAALTAFDYNPATGLVSFVTDSFSPFAVTYSGEVFEIYNYEQFKTALEAIKASAKQVIPGETGNKAYRENAIFVLMNDIEINGDSEFMYTDGNGAPLHFYGVKGVLDLNGHNINVSSDALMDGKAHANAVLLFQYSNVSIVGNGTIAAANKSIPVYAWANTTVDIYGGNYVSNCTDRNESVVYVNNASAHVDVYGGTYTNAKYAFNVHDNCGTTTTIVLHDGIEYNHFLKNGTTNVTASDINAGRIAIADGFELVEYTVDGEILYRVEKI